MPKKKKGQKNQDKAQRVERAVFKAALQFLRSRPGQAFNHRQIAAGANVKGRISHNKLTSLLDGMADANKIVRVGRGKYRYNVAMQVLEGTLDVAKDGFGFLVPDKEGMDDIFIPASRLSTAFHGDRVKAKITKNSGRGGRAEGEVVEIVERARNSFIGTLDERPYGCKFIPDNPRIQTEFRIKADDLNEAKPGQKVLVEIDEWKRGVPQAHVTHILGEVGENDTEMHAILFQYGFDPKFPEDVEAEVAGIPDAIPQKEIEKRRDMRPITTFTIDPTDAKDFDDALSIEFLENGNYSVGVHIADVSYYVRPGTRLNEEALERATSVYLVDRTVPMLPEKLSNNLCSLRPNEDRLSFSAIFEIDDQGKIHHQWFGRTVIHSDRRFTYMEAQEVIEGNSEEYAREMKVLNDIAHVLRKKRFKNGAINFEEDEVRFELDKDGKPIRVYRKIRKDAHKMIEDWMLLANKKVSEYASKLRKEPALPFVYRIHDRPDEEKLRNLQQFVSTLGYNLELENPDQVSKSLNKLMTGVIGQPEQDMVQQVAVRAMSKAIYSTNNIGHYGLGFDFYSHFTSPIRRYPDLVVHRLLDQYLQKNFSVNPNELEHICKQSTNRERKATEAERASVKYKQVEFLEDKIGEEFEGIVSGVTKWGIYVEIIENKCEGMIGLHSLKDDYYEVDEETYSVRGRETGQTIRLGDKVKIEVKGTSLRNRTIDFEFVEHLESAVEMKDEIPIVNTPPNGPSRRAKSKRRR